jgi:acyl CoA:acetate/3-ketoacid CoA transferase alpha subunit
MVQLYGMDALRIGLTISGYGIPGLIFSPLIGKAVNRWGASLAHFTRLGNCGAS